jgi:hypothetical protein
MMASTKSRDLEAETVEMGTPVAVAAVEAMDIADVVDSGVMDVAVAEAVMRAGEPVDVAPTSPKVLRSYTRTGSPRCPCVPFCMHGGVSPCFYSAASMANWYGTALHVLHWLDSLACAHRKGAFLALFTASLLRFSSASFDLFILEGWPFGYWGKG